MSTVTDLKKEIVRQLCEDVIDWEEFDIGYTCGSDKVIHIRSKKMSLKVDNQPQNRCKGAPYPVAREVYRGLLCLRKILQKPTDSACATTGL